MPAIGDKQSDTTVDDASQRVLSTVADASTTAEGAVRRANASLQHSSDQRLVFVGALSLGVALGLVVAGSSRFLVALALAPATLVAGAVAERLDREPRIPRPTLH